MSKDTGAWPKEIVVCLECGAVSAPGMPAGAGFEHALGCTDHRPHGPTQRLPVLPASIAAELAEAIMRACERIESADTETEFGDDFEAAVKSSRDELLRSLTKYHAAAE